MRPSCSSRLRYALVLLVVIACAHPSELLRSLGVGVGQRQSSRLRALRVVGAHGESSAADDSSGDNTSGDLHNSSATGSNGSAVAGLGGALRRVQSLVSALGALFLFLLRLPLRPFRQTEAVAQKPVEGISSVPIGLVWAGQRATQEEWGAVGALRTRTRQAWRLGRWMMTASDVELLRFLRAGGEVEEAWRMLQAHAKWRTAPQGADCPSTAKSFADSPLHHELFWLGLNKEGLPTLVVRTQAHDGKYYKENPKVYSAFLVSVLERGRRQYGVGVTKQMCILMDRGGLLVKDGEKKVEVLDMGVVPRLVELVRHVVGTVKVHYPDILHSAKIAPASWFFILCYRITGRAMDPLTRSKFEVLTDKELWKLHRLHALAVLPPHLGGSSPSYTSIVTVDTTKWRGYCG